MKRSVWRDHRMAGKIVAKASAAGRRKGDVEEIITF